MGGRSNLFAENSTFTPANAFTSNAKNSSYIIPGVYDLSVEDTNWVLTSSFIIFTMQTGKKRRIERVNFVFCLLNIGDSMFCNL